MRNNHNPPSKAEKAVQQDRFRAEREARDLLWMKEKEICRCHSPRIRLYSKQEWCDLCSGWRLARR